MADRSEAPTPAPSAEAPPATAVAPVAPPDDGSGRRPESTRPLRAAARAAEVGFAQASPGRVQRVAPAEPAAPHPPRAGEAAPSAEPPRGDVADATPTPPRADPAQPAPPPAVAKDVPARFGRPDATLPAAAALESPPRASTGLATLVRRAPEGGGPPARSESAAPRPEQAATPAAVHAEVVLPDVTAPWSTLPTRLPPSAESVPNPPLKLQPAIVQRGLHHGSARAAAAGPQAAASPARAFPAAPAAPVAAPAPLLPLPAPGPRAPLTLVAPAPAPVATPAPDPGAAEVVRRRAADESASTPAAPEAEPPAPPAEAASAPTVAATSSVDVTDLAERVYDELVRRLAFEREARGEWR